MELMTIYAACHFDISQFISSIIPNAILKQEKNILTCRFGFY